MKNLFNIKNIILSLSLALSFSSCEKNDAGKFNYEVAPKKVVAFKMTEVLQPTFVYSDLDNAYFSQRGVFVGTKEDLGKVKNLKVYAKFLDNTVNGADNYSSPEIVLDENGLEVEIDPIFIKEYSSADFERFGTDIGLTIKVDFSELINILEVERDNVSSTDEFIISYTYEMEDGSVYTSKNIAQDLKGGEYNYGLVISVPVGCPIEEDNFSGDYVMTVSSATGALQGFFGADPQDVKVVSKDSFGAREFKWVYAPQFGGFNRTIKFNLICGTISVVTTNSGLGCGSGSITFGPSGNSASFDPENDEVITFEVYETGSCGLAATNIVTLTKK